MLLIGSDRFPIFGFDIKRVRIQTKTYGHFSPVAFRTVYCKTDSCSPVAFRLLLSKCEITV